MHGRCGWTLIQRSLFVMGLTMAPGDAVPPVAAQDQGTYLRGLSSGLRHTC